MVRPGSGHLNGEAAHGLTAHVDQIGFEIADLRRGRLVPRRPPLLASQGGDHAAKGGGRADPVAVDERGLARHRQRHHDGRGREGVHEGQHTRDPANGAVQSQFAEEGQVVETSAR